MKRFYKLVSIAEVHEGYHILLDARPVKTKAGVFLCAPNKKIAMRLMQEWAAQDEHILPDTMPFTQILNTQVDRVSKERAVMSAAVLKYLDTDLLCYHAAEPEGLVHVQQEKWGVWLDWFEKTFGYTLKTTTNLVALSQEARAHQAVSAYVHSLDDAHFTILQLVTSISGSLILGLALVQRAITAQQIFDACFVEEIFKDVLYNAEKYGADPILEKAQKAALQDFEAAQDYVACVT